MQCYKPNAWFLSNNLDPKKLFIQSYFKCKSSLSLQKFSILILLVVNNVLLVFLLAYVYMSTRSVNPYGHLLGHEK